MKKIMLRALASRLLQAPVSVAHSFGGVWAYLVLLLKSRNVHIAILLYALFGVTAYVSPFDHLYLFMTFVTVMVEILLWITYLPAAMVSAVAWPLRERDQLILGVWVTLNADLATRCWALTQRYSEDSHWMVTSHWLTLILFTRFIGSTLLVTAPDSIDGRVSKTSLLKLIIAALFGALVATILIYWTAGEALMTNPP